MILICLMIFLDGNCMFLGSVGFQGFAATQLLRRRRAVEGLKASKSTASTF
jgi:hypothetical protein